MKKVVMLAVTMFLIAAASFTAYAGAWEQKAGGWKWNNGDNTYPTSCWQWIDANNDGVSECYYFDDKGICLQSAVTPDGCTVNADGAWTVNGVVQTKKNAEVISAEVFFNTSKGNDTSRHQSISKYSQIIAHVVLHAPRWAAPKLKFECAWPDGGKSTGEWEDKLQEGDYAWVSLWYDDPSIAPGGTLTLSVYTDAGEKIGEGSVQITD